MKKLSRWIAAATAMTCFGFAGHLQAQIGTTNNEPAYGPAEQAKRIYERLTGLQPSVTTIDAMAMDIVNNGGSGTQAALNVMNGVYDTQSEEAFLSGTLKRMAAPWTNRDQDPFEPLNDYIATFIGIVRDDVVDFREMLYGDILYHYQNLSPAYSTTNNDHYAAIEEQALPLSDKINFVSTQQSAPQTLNLDTAATAGLMTTRAAAKAFFILGTNRAMLRFTLMNHLCVDLEDLQDASGVPDRIRQDVSRSPGGDSSIFTTNCASCHIGMDPLAQAFAYYNFEEDPDGNPDTDDGYLEYFSTPQPNPELGIDTRVQPKYHINANNFPYGYVTLDDKWDNYWRLDKNRNLEWDWGGNSPGGSGNGAKTLGRELANSRAFAQCQVKKVFKAVCLKDPVTTVLTDPVTGVQTTDSSDADAVNTITNQLTSTRFSMKNVFAEVADYCKGE